MSDLDDWRALARRDFFTANRRVADSKGSVAKNIARAQRDLDFARKYMLPVERVVAPQGEEQTPIHDEAYTGPGKLVNSRFLDGLDVAAAKEMGCVIKLLANCALSPDGRIAVGVHPTMVPRSHPLANIPGAYNAIVIESRDAGRLMFMGPGAGGQPTASAVMGDVVTAARNRVRGALGPGESAYSARGITPPGEVASRYYVSLHVTDEPGVLSKVAGCFAEHGISLQAVRQDGAAVESSARLGVMTHVAPDAALRATIARLAALPEVSESISVMRVEGN